MRRYMLVAAVTAAAALTGLAPAGGAPAGAAARGVRAAPGARLWVARFRSGGYADAHAMAVSPDGSRVFVTGEGIGGGATGRDYATVAYSAATGRQLWVRRYAGNTRHGIDIASSVAVSPGGTTVFVTGYSHGRGTGGDYATVAYRSATGNQLWVRRYNGHGNRLDIARSVAVSPAGGRVFVTGWSDGGRAAGYDYAMVAYSAATGRQLWVSRYNRPEPPSTQLGDTASAVAVSPGGGRVFVTGGLSGYRTLAYSAATGSQLWASRYNGPAGDASACCVAVSPAGTRVFVTGQSYGRTDDDYATVAYSGL